MEKLEGKMKKIEAKIKEEIEKEGEMVKGKYLVKGFVHAGLMNPWPVNREGTFEQITNDINNLAKDGWALVAVIPAGNFDREICFFQKK